MKGGDTLVLGLLAAVGLATVPAWAGAVADAPIGSPVQALVPAVPSASLAAPAAPASVGSHERSARLLPELLALSGLGVAAPLASYLGFTRGLRSFTGFFAGFGVASLFGVVVAPLGVFLAGHLAGRDGGGWHALLGTTLGLLLGALVGLSLATVSGPLYLLGLALFWAAPAAGALVGSEWGRVDLPPPGAVVQTEASRRGHPPAVSSHRRLQSRLPGNKASPTAKPMRVRSSRGPPRPTATIEFRTPSCIPSGPTAKGRKERGSAAVGARETPDAPR